VTCSRFCSQCAHSLAKECEDVLVNNVPRVLVQECLTKSGDFGVALRLIAFADNAVTSGDVFVSAPPTAPTSLSLTSSSAPVKVPSSSSVVVNTPVNVNVNVEGASASATVKKTRIERTPQEIERRNKQAAVGFVILFAFLIAGGVLTGVGFGTFIIGMAIAGIVLIVFSCCLLPIWACLFRRN
jgi:hypothetical protein